MHFSLVTSCLSYALASVKELTLIVATSLNLVITLLDHFISCVGDSVELSGRSLVTSDDHAFFDLEADELLELFCFTLDEL